MAKRQSKLAKELGVSESQLDNWRAEKGFDSAWDAEAILIWREGNDEGGQLLDETPPVAAVPNPPANLEFVEITIRIPVSEPQGYLANEGFVGTFNGHVECQVSDPTQAIGLRWGHAGCQAAHARLDNGKGRHVDSRADYIKYLCELIGQEIAKV